MTYLRPKALLMVRPVKRVLVTRVPLVCHVSHSGCESYLCYVPGPGESTLCFEWLLRTQHLIGLAFAKQGRSVDQAKCSSSPASASRSTTSHAGQYHAASSGVPQTECLMGSTSARCRPAQSASSLNAPASSLPAWVSSYV